MSTSRTNAEPTTCDSFVSADIHGLLTHPDLDLEDLDATQLEELVDPPDLEPSASSNSQPAQAQVNVNANPANDVTAQAGQQDDGPDRIRPSDMPDEGLVVVSFVWVGVSRLIWCKSKDCDIPGLVVAGRVYSESLQGCIGARQSSFLKRISGRQLATYPVLLSLARCSISIPCS
jgi:hypothetical protein